MLHSEYCDLNNLSEYDRFTWVNTIFFIYDEYSFLLYRIEIF